MPTDGAVDHGLLSPVTVTTEAAVSDAVVLDALVTVEIGLVRAWDAVGCAPEGASTRISTRLGWQGSGELARGHDVDLTALAADGADGGNPVIPLVGRLRESLELDDRAWVHRGATSQDILDSALMLVSRSAGAHLLRELDGIERSLAAFAGDHADLVTAARTLAQHAVPTTMGMRAANWLVGVRRARRRLDEALRQLPAQWGGAAGTLASVVEHARALRGAEAESIALALTEAYAHELGLAVPEVPWHTTRWPVTELGDALVQVVDALGVIAADVITLSRTEIGELAEAAPGGSSAMPQKRNPVASVLIRSAAVRAPHLGAALHTAAALAVDERPDGAWHAEWPTLRELLRLALGAGATCHRLTAGLQVDQAAVARNLDRTGGLLVAERLAIVLGPVVGAARIAAILGDAEDGEELGRLLRTEPALSDIDVSALLDPVNYTGVTASFIERVLDEREPR